MNKLRLLFSKTGRAKYISHLDLMSTMRRAFLRAGITLEYSKGFNPHPYLSAALPLSVGCESLCELIDIGTSGEILPAGLPGLISCALPEGLEVLRAYEPSRKFNEISWIEISGKFYYEKGTQHDVTEKLANRFKAESIIISKKTKRSTSEMDIASNIQDLHFSLPYAFGDGKTIDLSAKISAQNPSIKPEDIVSALKNRDVRLSPDFVSFTRIEIFDREMNVFR